VHVGGKIEQRNKHVPKTRDDLSMADMPGVARGCQAIAEDRDKAFQYTIKRNTARCLVAAPRATAGRAEPGARETPQPPQVELAVHADAATGAHRERRRSRSA
jgi:malic enzyme